MNIKLLDISDEVFLYYRSNIKGNKDSSRETIRKKLTRNKYMSIPLSRDGSGETTTYSYGNMRFMVRGNKVLWVKNNQKPLPMWRKDLKKFKDLGTILKISD